MPILYRQHLATPASYLVALSLILRQVARAMACGVSHSPPRGDSYAFMRSATAACVANVRIACAVANPVCVVYTIYGITTTRQIVWRFEKHVPLHGYIELLLKSGRPTTPNLQQLDSAMDCDGETIGKELVALREKSRISSSEKTWTDFARYRLLPTPNRGISCEDLV